MNLTKETFAEWVTQPGNMNADSLPRIQELVDEYPWFQTGHILLARVLKNMHDDKYPIALARAAACTTSRSFLYHFLHLQPPAPPKRSFSRKVDAIIEKFLKEEPRINPPNLPTSNTNEKADHSGELHQKAVSETLARLYLEQGNPERAMQIYEQLMLIIPEKRTYFAAQIEKIRTIRNSTT